MTVLGVLASVLIGGVARRLGEHQPLANTAPHQVRTK
jgi:hypothetical protein